MAKDLIKRSAATLSWIDPVTKLQEVDKLGDPGDSLWRGDITARHGYRFANFLEVWMEAWNGAILGHGFTDSSGIYCGPSYLNIRSEEFVTLRKSRVDLKKVTYTQIVGARTQSPNVIAEQVGYALSLGLGGQIIATKVLENIKALPYFPPIWSAIELTVCADGWCDAKLLQHSYFPSLCFYTQDLDITTEGKTEPFDSNRMRVQEQPGPNLASGPFDWNSLKAAGTHRVSIDSKPAKPSLFSESKSPGYSKQSYYDGVPNLGRWVLNGWGTLGGNMDSGPSDGNPWSIPRKRFGTKYAPTRFPGELPPD